VRDVEELLAETVEFRLSLLGICGLAVIAHDPTLSPQVGAYCQDTRDGGDAGVPGQADQDVLTTGVVKDPGPPGLTGRRRAGRAVRKWRSRR
jgi:hypothetical protein